MWNRPFVRGIVGLGGMGLGLLLVAIVFLGGQQAGILSTVGSAVGPIRDQAATAGANRSSGGDVGVATGADPNAPAAGAGPKDDALIVRTGHLELQVTEVDRAVEHARTEVEALGGYIGASDRSSTGDHPVATVTYRIPVDRWDDGLAALRALGTEVLSEQTNAAEVTAQAVDLDARIKNLRAAETALQAVQTQAQKIPDILAVQEQLTSIRGQIEELVAQRNDLGDRAALGTIDVTYGTEVVAVTVATRSWDPASEIDRATATLVDILQGVAGAGIWFAIVWLPILVTLGLLILVVALGVRWLRRPDRIGPPSTPAEPLAGGTEA
jgi:hypothetical protein